MNSAPAPNAGGAGVRDDRDYLDKALDAVEKKFGGNRFADPNKNRAMNEKITDFIRKMIEKVTGYVYSHGDSTLFHTTAFISVVLIFGACA